MDNPNPTCSIKDRTLRPLYEGDIVEDEHRHRWMICLVEGEWKLDYGNSLGEYDGFYFDIEDASEMTMVRRGVPNALYNAIVALNELEGHTGANPID